MKIKYIAILSIILIFNYANADSIGYSNAILDDNPEGYWQLNESTGSTGYDSSSSNYNGTYYGGVTLGTEGPFGENAAGFNGSSGYLQISDTGTSNLDVSYVTMEAWINPSSLSSQRMIMNKESTWEVTVQNGYLQSAFYTNTSGGWWWKGSYTITANTWAHIAVTYDGSIVRHYVNGVEVENYAYSGTLRVNDHDLRIGARGGDGGASAFFQGSIAHASVFNTALTADQIAAHYNAENVPEPSMLLMIVISIMGIAFYRLKK